MPSKLTPSIKTGSCPTSPPSPEEKATQALLNRPLEDVRYWATHSLFYLCQLLFEDVSVIPHGEMCTFLEDPGQPILLKDYKEHRENVSVKPTDKLLVGYRGVLKSSILQALLVQLGLKNPNIRILVVQNNQQNAENTLGLLRRLFDNPKLQEYFPDIIPPSSMRRTRYVWSNRGICLQRTQDYPEPTYTAAGLGKELTSRHYNIIVCDDIVTAKKDNFSAEEIRPNPFDIQKAIGWHNTQSNGLMEMKPSHRGDPSVVYPPQRIYLNNRWCTDDFVDYIERFEPTFEELVVPIIWPEDHPKESLRGLPSWPEGPRGKLEDIQALEKKTPTFIWNTQYLCNPIDPKEQVFNKEWIQFYLQRPPVENVVATAAFMDPALSLDKSACFTALVVVAQTKHGEWYVLEAKRDHIDTNTQLDWIFSLVEGYKDYKLTVIGVEDVLFQNKLLDCIRLDPRFPSLIDSNIALIGEQPHKHERKEQRIESLQPRFRSGTVFLHKSHKELVHELIRFRRSTASTRDIVDALSYIPRLLADPSRSPRTLSSLARDREEVGISYEAIEQELLYGESREDLFRGLFNPSELLEV